MNTVTFEQDILQKRARLQSIADHTIEQATMDSQSKFAFEMAQEKLAAIDRTLRRMRIGAFGRCDECGGAIEPERLEMLIDSDRHLCVECAKALKARRAYSPAPQRARPTYRRLNAALEMA